MSSRLSDHMSMGKIPPQATEIEEAILGALMIDREAIEKISLKSEMFYKDNHQKIFSAITKLHIKNDPIDILTVTDQLRKDSLLDEVGGPYYISKLTACIASSSNIEYHCDIIADKYTKRELIRISSEIQTKAFDDSSDTFEVLDEFSSQLDALNISSSGDVSDKTWMELMKETLTQAQKRELLHKDNKIVGIRTPLSKLSKWTCGWQKKQLIVIGGRPSVGKSAWAVSCIKTAAQDGYKPALFSLEMSDVSLVNRFIIGESGVSSDNFRVGSISQDDWTQIDKAVGRMSDYGITIDDKPKSINKIRAKVKKLVSKGLCDMVVVDYIQLSWDDTVNGKALREQEVSAVSRALKLMAQELDIPVIALSQLNRGLENRPNKRPMLSDLRESGAIEQDADVILFIYRPSIYGIMVDEDGRDLNGKCELIVAKQREGQTGTVDFKYNESITAIYDWDEQNYLNNYNPDAKIEPNFEFDDKLLF
jgi:replicative DNA helicase